MSVRIENPKGNGPRVCTQRRADALVARGEAEITIRDGPRYLAIRLLDRAPTDLLASSARGYDRNVATDPLTE